MYVVQGQNGWNVKYAANQTCAAEGSTVDMSCTYTYPSSVTVTQSFWVIEGTKDLMAQSEYAGRAQYICQDKQCTLRIKGLRESDMTTYKFRFITNPKNGKYTGEPGVFLTVTALQIQVTGVTVHQSYNEVALNCSSLCSPDPPKVPSVSVSPSAEIVEGSSVTLTCSSDANPAANYTWYKNNLVFMNGSQFAFSSIRSSDSGQYCCAAVNELGMTLKNISVDVKWNDTAPVDLTTDPDYTGRVEYENNCTLRIGDLRESDSAVYKFKFVENRLDWGFTDSAGVTLFVTDLQVQVIRSTFHQTYTEAVLKCLSNSPFDQPIWFKNGQKLTKVETASFKGKFYPEDNIQCASREHEGCRSPPVYAPKRPSVKVRPSAEIVEGSSVTLTCSSDSNPAANYTWYKKNTNTNVQPLSKKSKLIISSAQPSNSGEHYCKAQNNMGRKTSKNIFVHVKYPPEVPSVSVSPSAEIVEGSSVTLTCSSDSNPAATYTWYKENEDSPKASGQIFTITDFRPEHGGNYYCEAQNMIGRQNSTLQLTVVAGKSNMIMNIIRLTLVALVLIPLFVLVIQGENDWGVAYPSTQICGIKGSTVDMHSTYTYPSTLNNKRTTVNERLWFTKGENHEPVDLKTDSDYTGRVRYHCENNKCTLTITDLRLSDSAVYKFRFISDQPGGRYTGLPGVTLSVTDLQMQVIRSETRQDSTWAEVKCHSSCLPDNPTFIWYKNGQKIWTETTSPSHAGNVNTGDYSCAVKGHENFPSPSLCEFIYCLLFTFIGN
ncbi:hypothetical protein Q5P01_025643 [Channa striata]|uniref:Ig-like domain-containing protein n=1 Tax=Channa striata TaxID=64152 RepID=A0AA88IIW8_CHASR|nr:hypothetical protein Q5P01_025643 [Channa striata]